MKIAVIGAGYVGLTVGVLLSQFNEVTLVDIDNKKIDMINRKNFSNSRRRGVDIFKM